MITEKKMNPLKQWIVESRAEQRRNPDRYIANYPELIFDDTSVMMNKETLEKIERHCGRYDGCMPTGDFCGKMFLRGSGLCWFGISKENPMQMTQINYREVVLVDE